MLGGFEAALAINPTHYRGRAALTAGLRLIGRLIESRIQGNFMRNLFPDEPFPKFVDGLADLLGGTTADGLAKINRVAACLPAEPRCPPFSDSQFVAAFRRLLPLGIAV